MTKARPCDYCGTLYVPGRRPSPGFCTRRCRKLSQGQVLPPRPLYAYDGRLSDELQREVAAARAEQATSPLYRPGGVL